MNNLILLSAVLLVAASIAQPVSGAITYSCTGIHIPAGGGSCGDTNGTNQWGFPEEASLSGNPVVYVDASRPDDSGDGLSWAMAKQTLQAGVDAQSAGGIVLVTNGVYGLGGATISGRFTRVVLGTNITLQSVNGRDATLIDGGSSNRGAYVSSGAVLDGFTIRNGYTAGDANGAGVFVQNGGAVSNSIIEDCTHEGTGSVAPGGGGVYLDRGGCVNRCIIRNSHSLDSGGGVAFDQGGVLRNCVLYGNSAGWGGGVYIEYDGTLENCTLSSNTALVGICPGGSGLAFFEPDDVSLLNNVIYGNSGVYTNMDNWFVYMGTLPSSGMTNNCTYPALGADCITNAPTFLDAMNGHYQLTPDSVGIDQGLDMPALTEDVDGTPRPLDGNLDGFARWDIGAYEFAPATNPPGLTVTTPPDYALFPSWTNAIAISGVGSNLSGMLTWSNEPTGATGEIAAGPSWTADSVALAAGTNRWTIRGTNLLGEAAQVVTHIERGGCRPPQIAIQGVNTTQPFSTWVVSGSNNMHVIGLTWTNALNGRSCRLDVIPSWTTTVAGLSAGINPIVFSGTNMLGETSAYTVTVTRSDYTVRCVAQSGSHQPPFTNWMTAATNIQAALDASADGDEVVVSGGVYACSTAVNLTNGIILRSAIGADAVIDPAVDKVRGVFMNHPSAILDGFTIRNARMTVEGTGFGGGILCQAGTILNCIVRDCFCYDGGGGVALIDGSMRNCTIVQNSTYWWAMGTGIRAGNECEIVNCIIRLNRPAGQSFENNYYQQYGTFINCATLPEIGAACITNDPCFVDPGADNFRLTSASPCINAGVDLEAWTHRDIYSLPRPKDHFDIGACEYMPVINAIAGEHGSINPSGEIQIEFASSTSFVVAADTYYHIGDLLTNSVAVTGAAGTYAFTCVWNNVRAEGAIEAAFDTDNAAGGTPHWWLAAYGLTNGGISFDQAELADTDADTFDAGEEYIADTNPTNANDFLHVTQITRADSTAVAFSGSTGRVYALQASTGLVADAWHVLPGQTNVPGNPADATILLDTNNAVFRAYRVGVQLPPVQ